MRPILQKLRFGSPTASFLVLVLIACVAIAASTGFWLLFRVAYIVGFSLVIAFFLAWLNTQGLIVKVERRSLRGQVGGEVEELIEIQNPTWFPRIWIESEDPSDMPDHNNRRALVIPMRRLRTWVSTTRLTRRGFYEWGPVSVVGCDPFGIFNYEKRFGKAQQLLVYPEVSELPNFQTPPANLPGEGRFRRRTHYVTPNASGIRDYAPGDPFSRIHWRSSARTGELMVKTFELDPTSDVWVITDMDQSVQFGSGDESTEEYVVRIAASIARRYVNANRSVGLMSFGETFELIEPERGLRLLDRIYESLAVVNAVGQVPIDNILIEEQRRFGRHTTLVIITSSAVSNWVTTVQSFVQRGIRVAVVLVDPLSFGGEISSSQVYAELTGSGVLTYVVKQNDSLPLVLNASTAGGDVWQG